MTTVIVDETTEQRRCRRSVRLDAVGWGLFFIWIGVIFLVKNIPDGVGSLGIGVIVLGLTLVRRLIGISISLFWIAIGLLFILAGLGEIFAIDLPLLPIALIVCGVLLLFHRRSRRIKKSQWRGK